MKEHLKLQIKNIIIIILTLTCLFYCKTKDTNKFSQNHDNFIKAYTELYKLNEKLLQDSQAYIDSSKKIVLKYHITYQDYKEIIAYYDKNPALWHTFFQTVHDSLKKNN